MASHRNIEHPQWPFSYKNITDVTQSESYDTQMLHVNNINKEYCPLSNATITWLICLALYPQCLSSTICLKLAVCSRF